MTLNKRQQDLLTHIQKEKADTVQAMAELFGVTQQTIRRDVLLLESLGLVIRFHGGASLPGSVPGSIQPSQQISISTRERAIAKLVARHIPNHTSVFINLGTTTEAVANALYKHIGLRVITNNLNAAAVMCEFPETEVSIVGGVVRPRDRGITGETAVDQIRQFNVEFAVIGVSSIDVDGTLREYDYREVDVTRAIMAQSQRVLLVADRSKFGRPALVRLGHLSQVDALYTDVPPPSEVMPIFSSGKPALYIAEHVDA